MTVNLCVKTSLFLYPYGLEETQWERNINLAYFHELEDPKIIINIYHKLQWERNIVKSTLNYIENLNTAKIQTFFEGWVIVFHNYSCQMLWLGNFDTYWFELKASLEIATTIDGSYKLWRNKDFFFSNQ